MEEIIIYKTIDGQTFEDEEKAIIHERKIRIENFALCITMWNYNQNKIQVEDYENWENVWYIYFNGNKENARQFYDIWQERYGNCPIGEYIYRKGLYIYSDECEDWVYVPDKIEYYTKLQEKFLNELKNAT